ncbi:MAG: metallo-mystery pair system four-Cys motif protein [Myxococcales bacterium]|nr:MAG: metallo-mystery pair system four-Cys motif protein [Myxococcales bacterium]
MKKLAILAGALSTLALGCGDSNNNQGSQAMAVEFAAVVGAETFVCGDTYDNLGTNGTSMQLGDFRFYVQEIELKNEAGEYVPLELVESEWQLGATVLMDFEDGCNDLGNVPTNSVATGNIPGGAYNGIRFEMGVPFAENHANPATASSPLNLTAMHWNWQGGYKFLRLDSGSFSMSDWRMHLGSTGCDGDPVSGGTTMCSTPNRVLVEFDEFDPATDTIVADFAALVADSALDENQPETPVGCMAGPMDNDCGPLFNNLGLPFAGTDPTGEQVFFSVE